MKENSCYAPEACELELALTSSCKAALDFPEKAGGGWPPWCFFQQGDGREEEKAESAWLLYTAFLHLFYTLSFPKPQTFCHWRHLWSLTPIFLSRCPTGSSVALLWSQCRTYLGLTAQDLSSPTEGKPMWGETDQLSYPITSPTSGTARHQ